MKNNPEINEPRTVKLSRIDWQMLEKWKGETSVDSVISELIEGEKDRQSNPDRFEILLDKEAMDSLKRYAKDSKRTLDQALNSIVDSFLDFYETKKQYK